MIDWRGREHGTAQFNTNVASYGATDVTTNATPDAAPDGAPNGAPVAGADGHAVAGADDCANAAADDAADAAAERAAERVANAAANDAADAAANDAADGTTKVTPHMPYHDVPRCVVGRAMVDHMMHGPFGKYGCTCAFLPCGPLAHSPPSLSCFFYNPSRTLEVVRLSGVAPATFIC